MIFLTLVCIWRLFIAWKLRFFDEKGGISSCKRRSFVVRKVTSWLVKGHLLHFKEWPERMRFDVSGLLSSA